MKNNITQAAQACFAEKNDHPTKALPASSAQIRIPTQRPMPQLNNHIKRNTQQVTNEWTTEVAHTDQLSTNLPPASETIPDLAPKRIQRFHQKKTSALLKKMAELHDAASSKVDNKVSIMGEASVQQKIEKDQDELWRDMIKPHEERHFQIGRITNFFS